MAASEEVAQGNSHRGLLFSSSELIMTASLFQGSGWGKFSAESNSLQWEHHRNTKGRGENRSHLGAPPHPAPSSPLVWWSQASIIRKHSGGKSPPCHEKPVAQRDRAPGGSLVPIGGDEFPGSPRSNISRWDFPQFSCCLWEQG